MKTHLIKPAVSQQVISHPEFATASEPLNPVMADALSTVLNPNLSLENTMSFNSTRLMNRLGFTVSSNIGKLATRIQKLANPPKGTKPNVDEAKAEIKDCLAQLVWGYDNLGDQMRTVEDAIAEWCGGGYSRPRTNEEIKMVADTLGISVEDAARSAETNRIHTRDYLAVRRSKLAPVMVAKITDLLSTFEDSTPPSDETITKTCQAAFENAILWGDWAEAKLIQADAMDWVGVTLGLPKTDEAMAAKANRIREQLTEAQLNAASKDAEALMTFDLDLAA